MDSIRYSKQYSEALKFMAVGKHGTPQWNPTPHPLAGDPAEVIAKRETDPLWQYHRGLRGGNSFETVDNGWSARVEKPIPRIAIIRSQHSGHYIDNPPTGMVKEGETQLRHREFRAGEITDGDLALNHNAGGGEGHGHLSFRHPNNRDNYESLWGRNGGRRPWWDTVFPLQDLENFAAPHDPYRLLAASVKSGNRHALPHLVDLLQQRDNPAGWYSGWTALAKAMEERIGDLQPHDVLRRVHAIAEATAQHSQNPEEHRQLVREAYPDTSGWKVRRYINSSGQPRVTVDTPTVKGQVQHADTGLTDNEIIHRAATHYADFTPYLGLADHMDENGLPQYAQLMRAELANVIPGLRKQPRRKSSRL